MENSTGASNLLSAETPLPLPFPFPPHRRRPLRSQTYLTLFRILSHCGANSNRQKQDDNGSIPVQPNEQNEIKDCDRDGSYLDVGMSSRKETENASVQADLVVNNSSQSVVGHDEELGSAQNGIGRTDVMTKTTDANTREVALEKYVEVAGMAVDNNHTAMMIDNQAEELSRQRLHEVENELSVHEICKAIDSTLDMDIADESSKPTGNTSESSFVTNGGLSEEAEHELHLKELEFGKLISTSSTAVDLTNCVNADQEIEEGEISGDIADYNGSLDFQFEDDVSSEEKREVEAQVHKDIVDKGEFHLEDAGRGQIREEDVSASVSAGMTNGTHDFEDKESGSLRKSQNNRSAIVCQKDILETKPAHGSETGRIKQAVARESDHLASSLEIVPLLKFTSEDVVEEKVSTAVEMDGSVDKRKRKKGPMTKERRAKKKKKERIKRAEKNRKLGVKRLKLQPVLKPKTVTYCRHYLKGRCQEGEKCKFSHDTIPLTKSQPCCHFARHSCLKGEDCPFDHQLSKYPCNNYLSKGYCPRGSNCLFSHEMPLKEAALANLNGSKPDLESPSLQGNLTVKNQVSIHKSIQNKAGAQFSSVVGPPGKTEQNVEAPLRKPASQQPKGVSFLLHDNLQLGDARKSNEAGICLKADDAFKLCHDAGTISDNIHKSNEKNTGVHARIPRGVNFLSFGKAPLDDAAYGTFSTLFQDRGDGGKKILLGDTSKTADSSPKRTDYITADNQTTQSTLKLPVRGLPKATPLGINLSSFGKPSLGDTSVRKQANFVEERLDALEKRKNSTEIRSQYLSSSSPSGDTLDEVVIGQSLGLLGSSEKSRLGNTPSSVQKVLKSTLAFAAKFESEIKSNFSLGASADSLNIKNGTESSQVKSTKGTTVVDFLYGEIS